MEVATGRSLGSRQSQLHSHEIPQRYPDLQAMADEPAAQLLHATAREAWKTLAPVVEKSEVRLATPWLQPGSWQVRRGVRAAKQGQWQLAEQHWQRVADRWWLPTPAAHHNLAIAMAAREDFDSARRTLQQATGPLVFTCRTKRSSGWITISGGITQLIAWNAPRWLGIS